MMLLEIKAQLVENGLNIELKEGEYIYHEKDFPDFLCWIEYGKILCKNNAGKEFVVDNLPLVGLEDFLLGQPYKLSTIALSKVNAILIEKDKALEVLLQNKKQVFQYIFSQASFDCNYE